MKFFKEFKNKDSLIIRYPLHHKINRWGNRARIKSIFPMLKEDKNIKFYNSLENCKVFVSDHFGTTFLEAMQSNIPSVIFLNKTSWKFRDQILPFYK